MTPPPIFERLARFVGRFAADRIPPPVTALPLSIDDLADALAMD